MSEDLPEIERLLKTLDEVEVSQHPRIFKEIHQALNDELNQLEA